jgi:serine/threonine protein phosphatase PrpC
VENFFKDALKSIQKKFTDSNDFEISGTCAVCILIIETKMYCINLGDSRAVLGTKKNGKKCAIEMSIDHKPGRDDEMRRINQMGGEVSEKILGILRVFKKNDDAPGLAVSRSMGDIMAHECGVISEPEVIEREIEPEDAFVVIASDGVWDAMGSTEVVGFIFDKMEQNKEMVANMLVEECRMRWEIGNLFKQKYMLESMQAKDTNNEPKMKNDESKNLDIDDITAIVHFITYYE